MSLSRAAMDIHIHEITRNEHPNHPADSCKRSSVNRWLQARGYSVGMQRLCQHNFGHNRYVWESGIMLAF